MEEKETYAALAFKRSRRLVKYRLDFTSPFIHLPFVSIQRKGKPIPDRLASRIAS